MGDNNKLSLIFEDMPVKNEETPFFFQVIGIRNIYLIRYPYLIGECYNVKYSIKLLGNGLYKMRYINIWHI